MGALTLWLWVKTVLVSHFVVFGGGRDLDVGAESPKESLPELVDCKQFGEDHFGNLDFFGQSTQEGSFSVI